MYKKTVLELENMQAFVTLTQIFFVFKNVLKIVTIV